jgi:hypothetical protein
VTAGPVEVRWLAGRGSCPGAVDLTTTGSMGRITRAVALSDALAVTALLDLLCPGSNWHETVLAVTPSRPNQISR